MMIHHNKYPSENHNKTKPTYGAAAYDSDKNMWEFKFKEWIAENFTIKDHVELVWSYMWGWGVSRYTSKN